MIEERCFTINRRTYYWCGGFGAIFKSFERGVKQGDVRVIGERVFYACFVYPKRFKPSEICWSIPKVSAEEIRQIRHEVFDY